MDCRLFHLAHLGLITVSGADTVTFLQGQCTNDIRKLTPDYSQLGSHCNHKGRMLALFRLLRRADSVYLQLPQTNLPPLLAQLNKYRMRSQVQINDTTEQLTTYGIAGTDALELLANAIIADVPATMAILKQPNRVVYHHPFTLISMHGDTPRVQVLGDTDSINKLRDGLLNAGATLATADDWILLEIRAGIPTVYPTTADAFIPQMTNLQLLDGVSFAKGCYTGQEVIARLQHLGTLKRHLFRAEVQTAHRPQPGDELYSKASESGQGAGRIVEISPTTDHSYELLAVVEISAVASDAVQLDDADGPKLRFLTLPY